MVDYILITNYYILNLLTTTAVIITVEHQSIALYIFSNCHILTECICNDVFVRRLQHIVEYCRRVADELT